MKVKVTLSKFAPAISLTPGRRIDIVIEGEESEVANAVKVIQQQGYSLNPVHADPATPGISPRVALEYFASRLTHVPSLEELKGTK